MYLCTGQPAIDGKRCAGLVGGEEDLAGVFPVQVA